MWEKPSSAYGWCGGFSPGFPFLPTFDERSARYKWNILKRAVKPKSKRKKKKKIVFLQEADSQFRYIALELCVATVSNYIEGKCKQFKDLDPIALLYQAMCGIAHLHSLGIGKYFIICVMKLIFITLVLAMCDTGGPVFRRSICWPWHQKTAFMANWQQLSVASD